MESLSFSKNEMAAIIYWAAKMAAVDGHVDDSEIDMITSTVRRFGISSSEAKNMFLMAETVDPTDAVRIVSLMPYAKKRFVTAYLGTQIAIDYHIDDKEMALWALVSSICNLPTMSIKEAIDYMAD